MEHFYCPERVRFALEDHIVQATSLSRAPTIPFRYLEPLFCLSVVSAKLGMSSQGPHRAGLVHLARTALTS